MEKRVLDFIAVDIETTGFSHVYDSIIQIGAVHIYDGKLVNEFDRLIYTSKLIPEKVKELTGISDYAIAGADSANIVLSDFVEFCGARPIAAHNTSFDMRFLKHKIETKLGIAFNNTSFCTMQYAKKTLKELDNHQLNTLARYYGIPNVKHHNALNDAKVCADIALCQMNLPPTVVPRNTPIHWLINVMNNLFE